MKYFIKNNEAGLLFNKQKLKGILSGGEYSYLSFSKNVIIVDKKQYLESYGIDPIAENNNMLNSMTSTIKVKDNEVAFHFIDGLFNDLLTAGSYSFFNEPYNHTFTIVDLKNPYAPSTIDVSILESNKFKETNKILNILKSYSVLDGFVGILNINGVFEKVLNPGKYYFFSNINIVEVKLIDLRNQLLQVLGQELLTKDKVTLRLNFILTYKTIDAIKAATAFDNYNQQLYILVQLALREYVSIKTLDELLAEKQEMGRIILESIKAKEDEYGSIFIDAGIKDIILPGEIRDILNTILIAEKKALANVITRREETASTRSLLNTAKLMDENATLYKLKELEFLEKICDKVGNISLSSSGGIIEQLNEIIKVSK